MPGSAWRFTCRSRGSPTYSPLLAFDGREGDAHAMQAGVTKVVFYTNKLDGGDGKVDASYVASSKMFELAGVQVYQHQPDLPHIGAMFQQL